jgi:hypothetical protein
MDEDTVMTEKGFDAESVPTDVAGTPDVDRADVEQAAQSSHTISEHENRCCPEHHTHASGGRPHSGNCILR